MEKYLNQQDTVWENGLCGEYELSGKVVYKSYGRLIPTEFIKKLIIGVDPNFVDFIANKLNEENICPACFGKFETRMKNKDFITHYLVHDSAEELLRKMRKGIFDLVSYHRTLIDDTSCVSFADEAIRLLSKYRMIKKDSSNLIDVYSPIKAYIIRQGLCFEKASLIVAIARANNIPARIKGDLTYFGYSHNLNETCHFWAEIYNNKTQKWHKIESVRPCFWLHCKKFMRIFRLQKGEEIPFEFSPNNI